MSTSNTTIKEILVREIMNVAKSNFDTNSTSTKLHYPKNTEHGDYASTIAMEIGKEGNKNPLEVAEEFQKTTRRKNIRS